MRNICKSLASLVGNNRKRAVLPNPSCLVQHKFWHRLLNHLNVPLIKPVNHIKSVVLILPTLVSINVDREICNAADSLNHHLVCLLGHTKFNLYNLKAVRILNKLLGLVYNLRLICKAYGVGCARCLLRVKAPHLPPRLAYYVTYKIVERNIHRGLCGAVVSCYAVQIFADVVNKERRTELAQIYLS